MNARVRSWIWLVTGGLFVTPCGVAAQQASGGDARQAVERLLAQAVERGFAGQVLVVQDGETILHEGYGLADPDSDITVGTQTVFAIGSVTKQFTRAAILKLEEDGFLSTDDPIARFMEGLPRDKREITIEQLMTMRAGFHEYHDDTGDHQPMTRDEAVERIKSQKLLFEPGTQRAYSNSGFTLLAVIVEKAAGTSFTEYVRRNLLEPAGLSSTGFYGETEWADSVVARGQGGMRHGENRPNRWPAVTWALMGAGGMVAPAADLKTWIEAVRGGKVLGQEALAKFYPSPQAPIVYAGGDDFGFTTVVIELDGGNDLVITNSHSSWRRERLAVELAEAVAGKPLGELHARLGTENQAEGKNVEVVRGPGGGPEGGKADSPRERAASAFERALADGSDAALRGLITNLFAPEMREAFRVDEHLSQLRRLSEVLRSAQMIGLMPRSEFEVDLVLRGPSGTTTITLGLEPQPPHQITGIQVHGG